MQHLLKAQSTEAKRKWLLILFCFSVISDSLLGALKTTKELEKRRSPEETIKQYIYFFKSLHSGEKIQTNDL